MKTSCIMVICCSAIFACVDSPDQTAQGDETSQKQQVVTERSQPSDETEACEKPQNETIDTNSCLLRENEVGDNEYRPDIEQWDEGEDDTHWYTPIWPFPWPWHHGHKGGPGDKPDRKECYPELGVQQCLDCCYYNHDKVDGWECRRKRKGSKAEARCWREAIQKLADCQVHDCKRHSPDPIPPIITTVQP